MQIIVHVVVGYRTVSLETKYILFFILYISIFFITYQSNLNFVRLKMNSYNDERVLNSYIRLWAVGTAGISVPG